MLLWSVFSHSERKKSAKKRQDAKELEKSGKKGNKFQPQDRFDGFILKGLRKVTSLHLQRAQESETQEPDMNWVISIL